MAGDKLRVIPLGGLGEIGMNMMALEYGDDIVVIDCGVMFPDADMQGVDLVIPDMTYLLENKEKVRAVLITHGHEDHTGALPWLLRRLNVPVYAPRLAHGLIEVKLKEYRLQRDAQLHVAKPGVPLELGAFAVEWYRVCHSIPDSMGLIIRTPVGTVVHSGDYKIDHTPVDGKPTDFGRLAQVGNEGVLLFMSDSTYAEVPGYTPSEQVVSETLEQVIAKAPGRVIIATFASLISRIQQVINGAAAHDRRVCVLGRSMENNVQMALKMGYLAAPTGLLVKVHEAKALPPHKVVFVATGTQGEPSSVLVRVAHQDHRDLSIIPGDTVVFSASAIPGNETVISKTIDDLFRLGANVLYDRIARVHVHGHASQEEQKMMISLLRPRFFLPVHGEYRHMVIHSRLAQTMGIPPAHTFVLEDGDVLELNSQRGDVVGRVPSGPTYVDGLRLWGMDSAVLRDRRLLSRDGFVVVMVAVDKRTGRAAGRPDVVSAGFVEEPDLLEESRQLVLKTLGQGSERPTEWSYVNTKLKDVLGRFFYERTKRRPMIVPVTFEV
ncbi:MAG: ribonuclease J [Dehalococcoidia bacterium]|nr:ribonuclease J [Dehalococcoidia bacterium]